MRTTSSSAAASTRWSPRRCSAARAQGAGAGAQRPHRRLHPHRGDHRAGLRPRRDGDDLRAVHHVAGLCRARRRPRPARPRLRAYARRRPACCCPDGRQRRAAHGPRRQCRGLRRAGRRRRRRLRARDVDAIGRRSPVCSSRLLGGALWSRRDAQAAGARGLAARACAASPPSSARRSAPARGWLETAYRVRGDRRRCSRPGCCIPGSGRRAPIPARWPRSSPSRWRPPARRSCKGGAGKICSPPSRR